MEFINVVDEAECHNHELEVDMVHAEHSLGDVVRAGCISTWW